MVLILFLRFEDSFRAQISPRSPYSTTFFEPVEAMQFLAGEHHLPLVGVHGGGDSPTIDTLDGL